MTDQKTTPTERMTYNKDHTEGLPPQLFEERGWVIREREYYWTVSDTEPLKLTRQTERRIKYRRLRHLSMSKDNPPSLPCRPFCDNGDHKLYTRPGKKETQYHQNRLDNFHIPTLTDDPNDCYTCLNHRECNGFLWRARRLTCFHCESEEGPLVVSAGRRARREAV